MGSSRLPGKVLMDLAGQPVLSWVVRAANSVPGVDKVAIATSIAKGDDKIAEWCVQNDITCIRGSEDDVLSRYAQAVKELEASVVMRLTADTPFLDPGICSQVLWLFKTTDADYVSNVDPVVWADGLDCEVFTASALLTASEFATRMFEREHVTPYIRYNRQQFSIRSLECPFDNLHFENWALDTPEDLAFLRKVAMHLETGVSPSFIHILRVLDMHPDYREINSQKNRQQGNFISLQNEREKSSVQLAQRSFSFSSEELRKAEQTIPLGAQTFSKSQVQFPIGAAPLFLTHGDGGRSWDVDGNEYVDLVSGLLCISLGYRDPDVDRAIRVQLSNGISFSLATQLERRLAERLVELIPSAEQVRFGKNGSDVTTAAVRLARAYTGRNRVISCGYHGWQDWYIGTTTRHRGVPDAVRKLTHPVPYNDLNTVLATLNSYPGEFAALIMEPVNAVVPDSGYLESLQDLLKKQGVLLIFDEMITGFRFAIGGAQELFGITPDLSTFGKGMANGMPISAIVGQARIMSEMENIFFSSTFGGETLSLAAAIATIDKMCREPVIDKLWKNGEELADKVLSLISYHSLEDCFNFQGMSPWKLISISDIYSEPKQQAIKTMLIYEMAARGVLTLGSHNISYAHNKEDFAHVLKAYDGTFSVISKALKANNFEDQMKVPPIVPVFDVR